MRSNQTTFGDGWQEYVYGEMGAFLKAGEQAIARLLLPRTPYSLELRFLDGLHWFGIACREPSSASKIVASVFVIERLAMTGETIGAGFITRAFAQRAVVFAQEFAGLGAIQWFRRLVSLYDMRSRLVHGDISPADTTIPRDADFALLAARAVLLGSLVVYGKLANGLGADKDLQRYFELMAPRNL